MVSMTLTIVGCPECGAPAEVLWRCFMNSTEGPVEHMKVACIQKHHFFAPSDNFEPEKG